MGVASGTGRGVGAAGAAVCRLRCRVIINGSEGLQGSSQRPRGARPPWCTHASPLGPLGRGSWLPCWGRAWVPWARRAPAPPEHQRPHGS